MPLIAWAAIALFAVTTVFTYMQMRKMQKRNKGPEASQDVGSIAEEGTTISHGYGTYDMYPVYTEFFDLETEEIRQSGGGGKK